MTTDADALAYYEEEITIELTRITLLCMIGAMHLATKHPSFAGPGADLVHHAISQLSPLVDKYAPKEVLAAWLPSYRPS